MARSPGSSIRAEPKADPMLEKYFAHSGSAQDRSDWQPLQEHLDRTAARAAATASPLGLEQAARLAAAFHDFGKFDPAFDLVLQGKGARVDHSTAGGKLLLDRCDRSENGGEKVDHGSGGIVLLRAA
jgi:hypothetical protein